MQSFLINSTRESLNTFYNFLITELWKAKPLTILIVGLSHKVSIDVWLEWTSDFENVEHLQHMTSNNWCLEVWCLEVWCLGVWRLEVWPLEVWHLEVPLLTSIILKSVILKTVFLKTVFLKTVFLKTVFLKTVFLKTVFLKTVFLMFRLELPTLSMQYLNVSHLGVWLLKAPECRSLDASGSNWMTQILCWLSWRPVRGF